MVRTLLAGPLLGGLALVIATGSVHAQSTAFLYVGADVNQQHKLPGAATLSAFGTAASGQFAFINADATTTSYEGLSAFGSGTITVTGGTFQQLLASDPNSVINLIGTNLTQSKDFYFDNTGQSWYTVSGTLQQSQTPFMALWSRPSQGMLEFDGIPAVPGAAPVPEASTIVSLGLLLLGTACIAFKRRKSNA